MKKVISLFLAVFLMFVCCTTSFSAAEQSKISPELEGQLALMSDDETTEVCVWATYTMKFKSSYELTEYVNKKTREELGLFFQISTVEDLDTWKKTYNRILSEIETGNRKVVIEKLGLSDEIIDQACNMLIARLTKDQILAAAELDEVDTIELYKETPYDDAPWEEPIEDTSWEVPVTDLFRHKLEEAFADRLNQAPDYAKLEVYDELFEDTSWEVPVTDLFRHKLEEAFADRLNQAPDYAKLEVYDELCKHLDSNGEFDWALIRYRIGAPQGPLSVSVPFGKAVVSISNIENNYLGMSVYDVKKDVFIPIATGDLYHITAFDYSDYDGFEDALVWYAKNRSELSGVKIYLRGDADNDSTISILDATAIQRNLAELSVETFDDDHADYDLDGTVTIVDATGIQRELAGM